MQPYLHPPDLKVTLLVQEFSLCPNDFSALTPPGPPGGIPPPVPQELHDILQELHEFNCVAMRIVSPISEALKNLNRSLFVSFYSDTSCETP